MENDKRKDKYERRNWETQKVVSKAQEKSSNNDGVLGKIGLHKERRCAKRQASLSVAGKFEGEK
jgi:hypothetical protein